MGSVRAAGNVPEPGAGGSFLRRGILPTAPGGIFLTAAILISTLPVIGPIRDPDFWWHLRAGQMIIERRGLLGNDPFTYTAADHHWTMHEWLTEVGFAALHGVGGLGAIVVALAIVTWLGVLAIVARARLDRPRPSILAVGLLIGVVAGYPIFGPRAQMITFALTALYLWVGERHLRQGGRLVWSLVPLTLLWSNLHSGFVIGLGLLAVFVIADAVGLLLRRTDVAAAERLRQLATVILVASTVATVNPNGPAILVYALGTQTSSAQQTLIQEWHSPDFHLWALMGFEAMLLSMAGLVVARRGLRPRDGALVLVATVMALQSVRHIALYVAVVTPIWIAQTDAVVPTRSRRTLSPPSRPIGITALVLVVAACLTLVSARAAAAMTITEDSPYYLDQYPVCAADWLAGVNRPLRIFNQYGDGGYLAYRLSAIGDRVYIFGDAALIGDSILERYQRAETLHQGWESEVRGNGTDVVVFEVKTPLSDLLDHSSGWTAVYRDDHTAVYAPADGARDLQAAASPAGHQCTPSASRTGAAR